MFNRHRSSDGHDLRHLQRARRGASTWWIVLGIVALAAGGMTSVDPASASPARFIPRVGGVPDQYIVTLKGVSASRSAAVADEMARDHDAKVLRRYSRAIIGFTASMSAERAARLANDDRVELVEQDSPVWATTTQSGPPWGLDRIDQADLPLNESYIYNANGSGVTAYVVDTGIRFSHTQFGGRATSGFDAIDGGSADDCDGHGTHVAGTLGGTTYGVAKGVDLVAVRVLDCNGSGSDAGVIAGLDWIVGNHVAGEPAVANMSLGGPISETLDAAVRRVIADGVPIAVAAGNGDIFGRPLDACTESPARVAEALTASATNSADTKASWANYGTCVDIFAPGVGVISAWASSDSATASLSGTSMASPHVAGAAAVYLQDDPTATPAEVASALIDGSTIGRVISPGTGSPNRLLFIDPAIVVADHVGGGSTEVSEDGAIDSYSLSLPVAPTSTVVVQAVSNAQFGVDPTTVTFTVADWATPQSVTISAVDDSVVEGIQSYVLEHLVASLDPRYAGTSATPLRVKVFDDDRGIIVSQSGGTTNVTEGGSGDSYTMVLSTQPSANVIVSFSTGSEVSPIANKTFSTSNWSVPQTVNVSAVNDSVDESSPHAGAISHSVSSSDLTYSGIAVASVPVSITDNDTAGVTLVHTGGSTSVKETGATSDSYSLRLNSQPTAAVTINITNASGQLSVPTTSLGFNSANWSSAQTVNVAAIDDLTDEALIHSATIGHSTSSTDGKYNGISVTSVSASITDNDVSGYWVDAFGGLGVFGPSVATAPTADPTRRWGFRIARGVAGLPGASGGYVLDGYGGVHPFGGAPVVSTSGYWSGWDIARGIALNPDGKTGYVMDGWGGLHSIGGAARVTNGPYWPGWMIARSVVLLPGSTKDAPKGYVLDGYGGIHPFGSATKPTVTGYWPGWDIARAIAVNRDGNGGYVLDGWGGLHRFGNATGVTSGPWWSGWDIARGVVVRDDGSGGYVLDGFGGLHGFSSGASVPKPYQSGYLGYEAGITAGSR